MSEFLYDRAAEALARLDYESPKKIAEDLGVTTRSISEWKKRLQTDPELQKLYKKLVDDRAARISKALDSTIVRIPRVLEKSLTFLEEACAELDPGEPEAVRAITSAVTSITELLFVLRKYQQIESDPTATRS